MRRSVTFLLLVVLLLLAALPVSAASSEATVGATSTIHQFTSQSVMNDLESALIGGTSFSVGDYPYIPDSIDDNILAGEKPALEIISFYEYGFSNFSSEMKRYQDYALFLYLYNPSNAAMRWNDARNSITLAVGDSKDYNKYSLSFCSVGGDGQGHDNLYVKYRVDVSSDELRALVGDSDKRIYIVSEIEVVVNESAVNASAYKVGGCYMYSGYLGGYGVPQTTLASDVSEQKTIDIECHNVVYRTDKNAADDGVKNQLNSVYFSISNEILEEYGELAAVKFGYYEYDSGSLLGVKTDNAYDTFKPLEGVAMTEDLGEDLPGLFAGRVSVGGVTTSQWDFNCSAAWTGFVYRPETVLSYVFKYDAESDHDEIIDSGVVAQFNEWWRLYNLGESEPFFSRITKPAYTVRELDNRNEDDKYIINSFNGNWFQQLFGQSSGYEADDFAPIARVTVDDLSDIDGKLKVASYYADELRAAVNSAVQKNETVHLLRYAASDYYAQETQRWTVSLVSSDYDGFVAQEKLYMDFDIISLTFSKAGKDTVIPVAASPINDVAQIETPSETLWDKITDGFSSIWKKILLIALVVILVILVAVLFPILLPVFSILIKLLLIPFKLLGRFFSRLFSGKRK